MNILLDTHIALWALTGDSRLSSNARVLLEDPTNKLYISTASLWEIAIKHEKRPNEMKTTSEEFFSYCKQAGITSLPIVEKHVFELKNLSNIHGDPFDRILLAQASSENYILMTHDEKIANYKMECVIEV